MAAQQKLGDFGVPRRQISRTQVVAIFDLVGFTDLESNKELLHAVKRMETQIELVLDHEPYYWGDLDTRGYEKPANTLLLRSTGDGYVIAFSQKIVDDELQILELLSDVHKEIRNHADLRLGINQGSVYVVKDLNERVNIVGWGINLAARALQFAEPNQIICTQYFAGPLINSHGHLAKTMGDIGVQTVKKTDVHLFNYYKRTEFGAPLTKSQKNNA